jgi:hypothetical protein
LKPLMLEKKSYRKVSKKELDSIWQTCRKR